MTRSRRGRGGHGGGGGGGGGHGGGDSRWLVTYADLLTLLMVLFLVLWVISTIDLKKFEKFKSGLGDFGNKAAAAAPASTEPVDTVSPDQMQIGEKGAGETTVESTTTIAGEGGAPGDAGTGAPKLDAAQLNDMVGTMQGAIDAAGLDDVVDVHIEQRGLVVSVSTDNVLFASGAASLTTTGVGIIGAVAPQLQPISNDVIVEGYTDVRPLKRKNYDNWDLSVDRAVSVLKVLRDDFGIPPARLAATGYGEQRPLTTGTDDASLARNRRVEIVVVAAPDAPAPTTVSGTATTTATSTVTTTATTVATAATTPG